MPTDAISARIAAFTKDLEQLVREAAVEAVQTALSAGASRPKTVSAGAARHTPTRRAPTRVAQPARARALTGDIDRATITYVKEHPGLRLEQIAKALGVPSPGLKG